MAKRIANILGPSAPTHAGAVRRTRGFTLVETLLALAILVIMTGIVAMGVPVAFNTYTKAVDGSNAQVLLTTSSAVLRDELGMAQEVSGAYYRTGDGYWAKIDATEDGLVKHVYIGDEPGKSEPKTVTLISPAMQTDSLRVTYTSIDYADGVFTVKGLKVVSQRDGSTLAEIGEAANGEFKIRTVLLDDSEEG